MRLFPAVSEQTSRVWSLDTQSPHGTGHSSRGPRGALSICEHRQQDRCKARQCAAVTYGSQSGPLLSPDSQVRWGSKSYRACSSQLCIAIAAMAVGLADGLADAAPRQADGDARRSQRPSASALQQRSAARSWPSATDRARCLRCLACQAPRYREREPPTVRLIVPPTVPPTVPQS